MRVITKLSFLILICVMTIAFVAQVSSEDTSLSMSELMNTWGGNTCELPQGYECNGAPTTCSTPQGGCSLIANDCSGYKVPDPQSYTGCKITGNTNDCCEDAGQQECECLIVCNCGGVGGVYTCRGTGAPICDSTVYKGRAC